MTASTANDVYARARRNDTSPEVWKARVDLAACYQLFEQKGWTDGINTHLSARVPGTDGHFFLKPDRLLFGRVTASSLVELDKNGDLVDPDDDPVNPAGAIIHGAVLDGREDVDCVLHHHTDAGIAVSSLKVGLLPMSQHALQFHNRMGYHEYEGVALDDGEKEGLKRDLGPHNAMLLRNHGVLVAGSSVGTAFAICDNLEVACRSQLLAMQTGAEIHLPTEEVQEHTALQFAGFPTSRNDTMEWVALLNWLDDLGVEYAV